MLHLSVTTLTYKAKSQLKCLGLLLHLLVIVIEKYHNRLPYRYTLEDRSFKKNIIIFIKMIVDLDQEIVLDVLISCVLQALFHFQIQNCIVHRYNRSQMLPH
jgi:hypothetical protein